ncbi:hypothetical protein [Croceicoccus naphthovorans]|uniref:Uncharacterized protein n=1 Tax=Croceicoccus naphthovorans TaxID=1348774 RepID=A0A0G3XKP3_9SPHN|nr:hypothetical protein [Croceicoccus naphthovorans]AKM11144.1 hypothetical protein AB433_16065 [Croceicoccus naphthovorans]MBB3989397.1 hypothetical protein [Croceicoccus naphthovorans]
MIGTAILSLAMLAGAPPIVTITCERDDKGNCIFDYSPKPLSRVAGPDREEARAYYRPYFECYYQSLVGNEGFGTSEGKKAVDAMMKAASECSRTRDIGDAALDNLLVERAVYGDEARRKFVQNNFRREERWAFLDARAGEDGLAEKLSTTSKAFYEAIFQ